MSEPSPTWPGPQLTPAQWRVLGAIQGYRDCHAYGPSYREIAEAAGLASGSVALWHVRQLERLGMIARDPGIARSIRVVLDKTTGGVV